MILLRTSYTVWFSTSRESKHHRFIRAGPGKQLQQLLPNSSNVLANPKPLPNATTALPQLHHVTQVGKNNRGFNTTKPKHTPKGMREEGIRTAASFSRNVRASQPPPDEHYIVGRRPHYDGTPASSRDLRVFRSTRSPQRINHPPSTFRNINLRSCYPGPSLPFTSNQIKIKLHPPTTNNADRIPLLNHSLAIQLLALSSPAQPSPAQHQNHTAPITRRGTPQGFRLFPSRVGRSRRCRSSWQQTPRRPS